MQTFVTRLHRSRVLPVSWQATATEWRRFGLDQQAQTLEVVAFDLEAVLGPLLAFEVGLGTASVLSGTSTRKIQRDVEAGLTARAGQKGSPLFSLAELVARYATSADERPSLLLERAA